MLQAIIKKGVIYTEDVPAPVVQKDYLLIRVSNSCISPGTELSSFKNSGQSILKRAINQPDQVKTVLKKLSLGNLSDTYRKVKSKLSDGRPTGYSISGTVIDSGEGLSDFKKGDRVAAGGAGYAYHSEIVSIPKNLAVHIPDALGFNEASTVTIGAIAMQGVRRAGLNLGEFAVIYGTGLIGLLSVRMLSLAGIRVAAIDIDDNRLAIARKFGAEVCFNASAASPTTAITNWSNGYGADAVLFTAATNSSAPMSTAFNLCRRKGRVILVGTSGMEFNRADLYEKELDFLMSTSYGPGRYDREYEEKGLTYPYAYVRWTETRNMAEYLRLLSERLIDLDQLNFPQYPIERIQDAFELLNNAHTQDKPFSAIISYPESSHSFPEGNTLNINVSSPSSHSLDRSVLNIALIGAGNFATSMHLPNIIKLSDRFRLYSVLNRSGHKAEQVAEKFNADYCTTDFNKILNDTNVDLVMISTKHDSHASLTLDALKAGKNVFVEKPLATSLSELNEIRSFFENTLSPPLLMVGFNRRFSKYSIEIKKHTDQAVGPLFIRYRMNAGHIPIDNWVHDDGGRIVGEACHLIDLMTFFIGGKIKTICVDELGEKSTPPLFNDNKSITLKYENGSVAAIDYFSIGNKDLPKEYMEIHFDQKTIILNNYQAMTPLGLKLNPIKTSTPQKGQLEELEQLYKSLTTPGSSWPIELWDMFQTTGASLLV